MIKSNKKGFTLAEVLTTLMVIGVVAAMTIPTLLNATNDQQLRVAYKKAQSVLSQGIQLMVAKEEECTVADSHDLAVCMQKVIAGSLYKPSSVDKLEVDNTTDANVIVTNDGLAYAFYYTAATGDVTTYNRSLDDICGPRAGNATADWDGTNSRCIVIIDMNGPAKGTHGFAAAASASVAGTQWNTTIGTDQMPVLLTGGGVRPLYKANDDVLNKGYTWIYGENAGNPAT